MKIAVLDDHSLILVGIKLLLEILPQVKEIHAFETYGELKKHLEKEEVDILLLDIFLKKGQQGVEICQSVKTEYPNTKIIGLSSSQDPNILKSFFKAGGIGFLPKNISIEDLDMALDTVTKGEQYIHPTLAQVLAQAHLELRPTYAHNIVLTPREKEVLVLIAAELTNTEIADKLFLSVKSIEACRAILMQKMEAKNMVGLIKNAMKYGFIS